MWLQAGCAVCEGVSGEVWGCGVGGARRGDLSDGLSPSPPR